jgi:molybdate transport system substrate-binding protein
VLDSVGVQFERETSCKLVVTRDVGAGLIRRINAGEPFDLFAGTPTQVDGLIKDGKVIADTRVNLVRSGIGMEVRAGAPKPDISTVEAFKRTLLDAKSMRISRTAPAACTWPACSTGSGLPTRSRRKVERPDSDVVSERVARGEVEIGMVVITQILTTPGVQLVGPLPPEIQSYIRFAGAISSNSPVPDVARALLRFLTGPIAMPVIRSQGMEPG